MTRRQTHPQSRVVVHLVTNQIASSASNATLPTGEPAPTPRHFAAFVEQAWDPAHGTSPDAALNVPATWQATWHAVRLASGLSEEDFEAFVRDCSLEFGFESGSLFQSSSPLDQQFIDDDIDQITNVIFATIADPKHITELSHAQLLQRLNWTDRFEYRNPHRFPVIEKTYREIQDTAKALTEAICELPGGYIAVLGAPGSGKSTLLTQHLRKVGARLIKYYAYVPGPTGPRATRGESTNFLHDVVLQLENAGFSLGESPSRFDRDQLLERFHEQLRLLHRDWLETDCKTIILVDGLDHIEREQHPSRSLLSDLPDPDQIPDGIYFVLGSQTDAPLSGRIKAEVRRQDRKIEMLPLSRQQVHEIISAADTPIMVTPQQIDLAYDLSNGHPLYLNYLINKMRLCEGETQLESELQAGTPYEGDIEGTYHSYWEQFQDDVDLQNLLGLLARIRGCIDLSWVETWADARVVSRLAQRFAHYFRIERNTRWYFFHNSFRLFLIEKTAEFPPGNFDQNKDRALHAELADRCAASTPDHQVWTWEELHHRVAADQHGMVLELATQGYFRSQFMAFRPLEAIRSDIKASLRSVVARQDPVALVRLCLIGSEMSQRGEYLDQGILAPLLLGLGQQDVALECIRSGVQVRGVESVSLGTIKLLMEQGLTTEARHLLSICEPIVPLIDSTATGLPETNVSRAHLRSWIQATVWFYDSDEIIDSINYMQYEDDDDKVNPAATRGSHGSLKIVLLSDAGLEFLRHGRWPDLARLLAAFDVTDGEGALAKFRLHAHVFRDRYRDRDIARAREHLDAMLEINRDYLRPRDLVALAEGIFLLMGDNQQAKRLLDGLPEPEVQMSLFFPEETLRSLEPLLYKSRFDYLLGDRRSPMDIIPESCDPKDQGEILLQRAICTVGQIWAKAWIGQKYDDSNVKLVAQQILRLYCRPEKETFSWRAGHTFRVLRTPLHDLLIDAVSEHGQQALAGLHELFELEWNEPDLQQYWPVSVRRSVIRSFISKGCSKQRAAAALRELDGSVPDHGDVNSRVEDCMNHAEAWVEAGNHERAQHFLNLALEVGFGVGYRKDYQMDRWIDWLDKVNEIEPDKAAGRISHFAHAVRDLDDSAESEAMVSAAKRLIATTFHWSPTRATQLFLWFADQWVGNYWKGMSVLLTEALKETNPPMRAVLLATREFLLPFDTIGNAGLMTDLVERLSNVQQEDQATTEINALISKIQLDARPSMRAEWLTALMAGLERTGLPDDIFTLDAHDLEVEDEREGHRRTDQLPLRDDSGLLEYREVEERVKSVADFSQLLEQEAERSFFNWIPLATTVIRSETDKDALVELAELFRNRRSAKRVLAEIGKRLAELREERAAWEMATEALQLSDTYDWHPEVGGNIKIDVFRTLSRLGQERAVTMLYETLVEDLESTESTVTAILEVLEDILDLLEPTATVCDTWTEIEHHTSSLLRFSSSDPPADVFSGDMSGDTPHKAIVEFISAQLGHSCVEIAQAAQRCLGQLLLDRADDVSEALAKGLQQSDEQRERILILIDSVSSIDPDAVAQLGDKVRELTASSSWLTRMMSRRIIGTCGWPQPASSLILRPLPAVYSSPILAPHPASPQTGSSSSFGGTPFNAQELLSTVAPYKQELLSISKIADVPVQKLYRRVVAIMHQTAPQGSAWSEEAERRMRSHLRSLGIRLPYARPRANIVRSAMFRAVAELVDGGQISPQGNDLLQQILRTYDPRMVLEQPTRRPAQILRGTGTPPNRDVEEWVQNVDDALSSTDWIADDQRIVLAERTDLTIHRDRGSITETRYGALGPWNLTQAQLSQDPEAMFMGVVRKLVSEYPSLHGDADISALVLSHDARWVDSPGGDWLALNPAVAFRLGWSISDGGMFRWVNDQDHVMAESIWWMDGRPMLVGDGLPEGEVGEGWLVLVSECALAQIEAAFGPVTRKSAVVRRYERYERYEKGSETIERMAVS